MTGPNVTRARRFRERWAVVQVPLARDVRDALDDLARDRGVTRSDLIREAVERWMRDDAKRLLSRDRSSKNAAYSP